MYFHNYTSVKFHFYYKSQDLTRLSPKHRV